MQKTSILYLFSLISNVLIFGNTQSIDSKPLNKNEMIDINNEFEFTYDSYITNLDIEEICNGLKTEDECHTSNDCSWCSSGAVKSQCHSLENADKLPSSIFLCDGLTVENDDFYVGDLYLYDDIFDISENENKNTVVSSFSESNLNSAWHPKWVDFLNFIQTFNKKYNENDIEIRFNHFLKNLDFIENNEYSFELGLNSYSDLSHDEFKAFVKSGGYNKYSNKDGIVSSTKRDLLELGESCSSFHSKNVNVLSAEIDWREKNAVTSVKDQGHCGSCWSFSATGSMEGAWAIQSGKLISLSEQQLIDCSALYGNNGCSGGLMESAFEYAIDKGMCSETESPYKAIRDQCSECHKEAHFSGCVNVTPKNQLHLKEAVSNGPVSVAIEADTLVFQFYKSGVINDVKCGTNLDHGVLVVGYGTENHNDYWIVKNSWGPGWGDKGYVKIARSNSTNDAGICGIALQPSYIVV
jgi:hypothetical protein